MRFERLNINARTQREAFQQIETWANQLVDTLNYNLEQMEQAETKEKET